MNKKSRASRTVPVLTGLILMILAALIFWKENSEVTLADPHHPGSGWMMALVPMMIVIGFVIMIRGAIWRGAVFSPRTIFVCGLVLLALGAFPWIYTGSDEGGGMLGTLLFLSLGIPGVIVTLVGLFFGGWRRNNYE
jgi:hypothetical protein